MDEDEQEEAPRATGCDGEQEAEVPFGAGVVLSPLRRTISCRSVSFSDVSSCRSLRTLVSSLVKVSSLCRS